MKLTWDKETDALQQPYLQRLEKRKLLLLGDNRQLCDLLCSECSCQYNVANGECESWLVQLTRENRWASLVSLYDTYKSVFRTILGDEYGELYRLYLLNIARYPYQCDIARRSLRSSVAARHCGLALRGLKELLNVRAFDLADEELITRSKQEKNIRDGLTTAWFTVHLLRNNPLVIDYIRDALCSENNHTTLTYPMLSAIVSSDNHELLELEGKLLLAARLQEGLRQSIVETMDSGTVESHLYLMKIMLDNDLIRYSAVFRGILTWCGIGTDYIETSRIPKKIIGRAYDFLTDETQRQQGLESNDNIEQYLALWSMGFYEFQEIGSRLRFLLHENQISGLRMTLFAYVTFCYNYDNFFPVLKEAVRKLYPYPDMVASGLDCYLSGLYLGYDAKDMRKNFRSYPWEQFFESEAEALEQFKCIEQILGSMTKDLEYGSRIFPWLSLKMTRQQLALILAKIALMVQSAYMKENVVQWLHFLSATTRLAVLEVLGSGDLSAEHRKSLFAMVPDRSPANRECALTQIAQLKDITDEEYKELEENLRLKYEDMRSAIIPILLQQKGKGKLEACINRLLHHASGEVRLAGLDMMMQLRKENTRHPILRKNQQTLREIIKPSAQEKVLIDQLLVKSSTLDFTLANGLGLLTDGKGVAATRFPSVKREDVSSISEMFPVLIPEGGAWRKILVAATGIGYRCKALTLLERMCDVARSLCGREYRSEYGQDLIYGQEEYRYPLRIGIGEGVDAYPFADVWKTFYETDIKDDETLFQLRIAISLPDGWDKAALRNIYAPVQLDCIRREWEKKDKHVQAIVECMLHNFPLSSRNERMHKLSVGFVQKLMKALKGRKQYFKEENNWGNYYLHHISSSNAVEPWLSYLNRAMGEMDDEAFASVFAVLYRLYEKVYSQQPSFADKKKITLYETYCLDIGDFCRAYELGLVSHDELVRELALRPHSASGLSTIQAFFAGIASPYRENSVQRKYGERLFPASRLVVEEVTQRILDIELARGDSKTEVSDLAVNMSIVEGGDTLIRILLAMGSSSFRMGSIYAPDTASKKDVLSILLQNSRPCAVDTPEQLREIQLQAGIDDRRMVEAALYVPEWAELIERAIGWEGLASACYYFHAHVSDECSEQKKAVIARYTPIDVEDFKRGVFDINWFREAYQTLGEKRFAVVYAAAKYVSNGTAHSRARKYADAVTGKVDEETARTDIVAKRNKDLLMSYGLIPIRDDADLVKRYQYIRQFQKESRAFGMQRQNSEKTAVEVALQNLSVNMGYEDVTRLVWRMETLLTEQLDLYFKGVEVEGARLYILVTSDGLPELQIEQNGKVKKSIPSALKKHPVLQEVKEVCKELKAQASRSRALFEKAMNDGTLFSASELTLLMRNPVLYPFISKLVFICDTSQAFGFYRPGELFTPSGAAVQVSEVDQLRIAHPVDLLQSNQWSAFQKYLFEKNVRQPFKQVFRELYMPTAEERESPDTRRYSGYQVQPVRAKALLAGRGWVADYESGLQRIYYRENVVAVLYSQADWFSPSEIECPSIEWVAFYRRRTGERIHIKDIPPRVFSEIMRDVDLAVSVAHVGGVDPETSHSTIEMRRVIVECILPLFKLDNVSFKGNFVYVEGKLASYNIHLGSAVVHQNGGSAINILPVHSQQRGKLFLPFVDEDPKTAELVAKVLLLAEDEKIKDPFITSQILVTPS